MKEAQDWKLTITHSDGKSLIVELDLANSHYMHEELEPRSA